MLEILQAEKKAIIVLCKQNHLIGISGHERENRSRNAAHSGSCHSPSCSLLLTLSLSISRLDRSVLFLHLKSCERGRPRYLRSFFLAPLSTLDEIPTAQEAVDLATEKSKLCYENKHIQPV